MHEVHCRRFPNSFLSSFFHDKFSLLIPFFLLLVGYFIYSVHPSTLPSTVFIHSIHRPSLSLSIPSLNFLYRSFYIHACSMFFILFLPPFLLPISLAIPSLHYTFLSSSIPHFATIFSPSFTCSTVVFFFLFFAFFLPLSFVPFTPPPFFLPHLVQLVTALIQSHQTQCD